MLWYSYSWDGQIKHRTHQKWREILTVLSLQHYILNNLSPCFVFVHGHCEQNVVIWIIKNPVLTRGYIASVPHKWLCGVLAKSVSFISMHFLVVWELKLHARFVILWYPWHKTKGYKELIHLVWSAQPKPLHFNCRCPVPINSARVFSISLSSVFVECLETINMARNSGILLWSCLL